MGDRDKETAERALLQTIIESIPIRVFWKDREGYYLGCNSRFAQDSGFRKPSDLIGKNDADMVWKDQADLYRADDRKVMESNTAKLNYEEPQTTPDGKQIWLRTSKVPLQNAHGDVIGILGIYEEITDLKQAEAAQKRLNRALRLLGACNSALIHVDSERRLLTKICRLAVDVGGYRMAWVGFAEHDDEKSVRPVAEYGFEQGYLEAASITWADTERGRGPTGTCIRTGITQVNQNFQTNPLMAPWRKQALQRDYRSSIALPMKSGEKTYGSLAIYAIEPDAFASDEVKLLEELANDLAYGIATLRTRAELDQSRKKIIDSLEGVIQVIAATVESRDPYTAGHQRRVAELSASIAREMALPEDRIHGLRLAAMIHDLGKIHIPAEILSKPVELSAIELEMVKSHCKTGYDILKDMQFPWPIADMVLQHHERMDGSGYPQGLHGDQILLEARILGVADVVEAMESDRPYRPALGIEAALDEIKSYRGTKYDAEVVDACIKVVSNKASSH